MSNKINVETGGFEDSAVIQHLHNDLFNKEEWRARNITDHAEADADYKMKAKKARNKAKK